MKNAILGTLFNDFVPKNDSWNAYFKRISLIFHEKCVPLQSHSLLCCLQGSTAGRTLHNVKASSMLCQLAVLNVRNSRLMVKDNVGSDCYWYARKRTGVCIEDNILSTLFPGYVLHTGAGRNSTRSPSRAILTA